MTKKTERKKRQYRKQKLQKKNMHLEMLKLILQEVQVRPHLLVRQPLIKLSAKQYMDQTAQPTK